MSEEEIKPEEVLQDVVETLNDEAISEENLEPSLEDKLNAASGEIENLKDAALRAMAEGENVRRRAEREKNDARLYAIDKFARDLLPIADTLGRAIRAINDELRANEGFKAFVEGIELTEKEFLDQGIVLLSVEVVAEDVEAGRLQAILPDWKGAPVPVYVMTETRLLPAKTHLFIDFLKEQLAR